MGMFSWVKKIFKPITKVFRTVGKFIKKGFQKLGKFMNKFGILGQIGMAMLTGMAGNLAMQGLLKVGSGLTSGLMTTLKAASAGSGAMAKVAGTIVKGVNATMKFGGAIRNTYNATVGSITKAIGNVVKPVMKRIANVIPGVNITSVDKLGNLVVPKFGDGAGAWYDETINGLKNTWEYSKASASAAKAGVTGMFGAENLNSALTPAQLSANARLDAVNAASPNAMKREALLDPADKAARGASQTLQLDAATENLGRPLTIGEKAAVMRGDASSVGAFQDARTGQFDSSLLEKPLTNISQSAIGSEGTGLNMGQKILDDTKVSQAGILSVPSLKDTLSSAVATTTQQNLFGMMNPREGQTLSGGPMAYSDFAGLTQSIYTTGGVNQDLINSNIVGTPKGPIDFNNSSFEFYNLDRVNNSAPNYAVA